MMEENDGNGWEGKKVFLLLKSGRKYTGIVSSFDKDFIFIVDKFGDKVMCSTSEISSIEEENK
jgi:small nuclear ribonucleoprotein (snRNP)-like protein